MHFSSPSHSPTLRTHELTSPTRNPYPIYYTTNSPLAIHRSHPRTLTIITPLVYTDLRAYFRTCLDPNTSVAAQFPFSHFEASLIYASGEISASSVIPPLHVVQTSFCCATLANPVRRAQDPHIVTAIHYIAPPSRSTPDELPTQSDPVHTRRQLAAAKVEPATLSEEEHVTE